MAASKTEIVNKALTLVGANPIVNLTDDTQNARIVNRIYEIALNSILSETQWNFATRRKLLAQSTEILDWYDTGEIYVYVRPNLVVRIFGANDNKAKWREEGDYIISDTQGLGVRYVYYCDEPSKYSASFTTAFIDKLASDIAFMVVNSKTLAESFLEKYEKVSLSKALADNSQVGTPMYQEDDAWILAKDGNLSEV